MWSGGGLAAVFTRLCSRLLSPAASMATSATAGTSPGMYSITFITAPSQQVAKQLASGLVTGKLVACVNIIPKVISIYEWEDKVQEDEEVLMVLKSRSERLAEVTAYVRQHHPYDVPEVISTAITQGSAPYLDWIGQVVPPLPPSAHHDT